MQATYRRDAAGAVIVAAVEGLSLTSEEERLFRDEGLSGVTLFRRNIPQVDHLQTLKLNESLQKLRDQGEPPLVIAVDQEGGRVSRFGASFPNLGPALRAASGGISQLSLSTLFEYGQVVGRELLKCGVNVNFAPVLDVLTNPLNHAIGDRVFGVEPEAAWLRAKAYLEGLQSTGVFGCLKHFPGQGDAAVDTHAGTAVVDVSYQTLWQRELQTFKELIPVASLCMISHCIYPSLDDREAGLSPVVIQDLLRGRLAYDGVVVSDDLNMGALSQNPAQWQSAIIKAVNAGCDMLLVCRHVDKIKLALEALRAEASDSPAFANRLEEAAQRVMRFRSRLRLSSGF